MKSQISRQKVLLWALPVLFVLTLAVVQAAQAQTFKVLYDFTGYADGYLPTAGLTWDTQGNLYGVTAFGGTGTCPGGCGTLFELAKNGSAWTFHSLYSFTGGTDGTEPLAPLVLAADQSFYGTTSTGGSGSCFGGCGATFNFKPGSPVSPIHSFTGGSDGQNPASGAVVLDNLGDVYGTTTNDLTACYGPTCGNVYELMPSGTGWGIVPLYSFTGAGDGGQPFGGVIFSDSNHLFGTTSQGGANGAGLVYELVRSGSTWTEKILYNFTGGSDGSFPATSLIFDKLGNLYGTTALDGAGAGGTVFMLSPATPFWKYTLLHSFTGTDGPQGALAVDKAGNIYGTTYTDGAYGYGSVFKLTRDPSHSVSGWKFSTLHDFTGGIDGDLVSGGVILDGQANLYGITWGGGKYGGGTIFEIIQ